MDERTLYRQLRWALLLTTLLFTAFGWMTAKVDGFGIVVVGLFAVAAAAAAIGLWLTFQWKVVTVIAVTMAILVGGMIGHVSEQRHPSLACTRGTYDCELQWAYYKIKVQIWFDKNTLLNNCLLASNLRDGPTRAYCYSKYNPGPFPKPPA